MGVFDWHCLSQSHQQSKTHTGSESWAKLLYWLMKYLAQSMLQLFRHTKIWCHCCESSKQRRHRWYKRSPHFNCIEGADKEIWTPDNSQTSCNTDDLSSRFDVARYSTWATDHYVPGTDGYSMDVVGAWVSHISLGAGPRISSWQKGLLPTNCPQTIGEAESWKWHKPDKRSKKWI